MGSNNMMTYDVVVNKIAAKVRYAHNYYEKSIFMTQEVLVYRIQKSIVAVQLTGFIK